MVPSSQRAVFASNGFSTYWRRVQKSFSNFVDSNTIGKTLNPDLFSSPSYNKRLVLPTAGLVSSVPIKRRVVEEIGTAIPVGKGKEKKIKKETVKKSKAEEGVVGTTVGQGTKKRKTGSTRKQLVIFKDPREMDLAAEKEVNILPSQRSE